MDRDFPCPKKRGEIQNIQSSNGSRVPDTLWDIFTGGEHGYCTNKLHLSDQANQPQQMSCRQPDRDRKSKSAQQIQTDAPIDIRTRSKVHQQDTAKCMVANETPYQSQFAMETKEQFLQLNKQSDEHQLEIRSKIQLICNQQTLLSEQHSSMTLELRKELAAIRVQLESKDSDEYIHNSLIRNDGHRSVTSTSVSGIGHMV